MTVGHPPLTTDRSSPSAPRPERFGPPTLRLAGIIGLLAFALNAIAVGVPRPWRDEAATHMANERTLPELWSMLDRIDAVHGSYYLLIRVWQLQFGESILSLRMLSVIALAVGAAAMTLLGAELFDRATALWAGLGYALLPALTGAASEARSYALAAALVTGAMLTFRLATRRQGYLWWVCYAVLAAASIYVFLYAALAYVVLAVMLIWLPARARVAACVSTVAAAALTVPLLIRVSGQAAQVSWLEDYHYGPPQIIADAFWGQVDWLAWLGVGLSLVAVGHAVRLGKEPARRAPVVWVLGWLVLPSVILCTVGAFAAVYHPRYLAFSVPALALVIGLLLSRLSGRRLIAALVVYAVACVPPLVTSRLPEAKPTVAAAVAVLAENSRPGDGLYVVRYDRHALSWSFPDAVRQLDNVGADTGDGWRAEELKQPSRPVRKIAGRLNSVQRVWIFADKGWRLPETAAAFARLGFHPVRTLTVDPGYPVTLMLLERTG